MAWDGSEAGHSQHAAMVYMLSQVEPGVTCPMVMTYAAVPALNADAALEAVWRPKLTARGYAATRLEAGGRGRTYGAADLGDEPAILERMA